MGHMPHNSCLSVAALEHSGYLPGIVVGGQGRVLTDGTLEAQQATEKLCRLRSPFLSAVPDKIHFGILPGKEGKTFLSLGNTFVG